MIERPATPFDKLARIAAIDGATKEDVAEAAYELGFNAGADYRTARAADAAQKKQISMNFDDNSNIISKAVLVRSELEREWYYKLAELFGNALLYEPQTFWVRNQSKARKYTPDYCVKRPDLTEVYLEIKPKGWPKPGRGNPYCHSWPKQLTTSQMVVAAHKITLFVLAGRPNDYEAFQVLGLQCKIPHAPDTLKRLGSRSTIPSDCFWK